MDKGITITIKAGPEFWLKHLDEYENITKVEVVRGERVNRELVKNLEHIIGYWNISKDDSILKDIVMNCPIGAKLKITYENIALGA